MDAGLDDVRIAVARVFPSPSAVTPRATVIALAALVTGRMVV